MHMWMGGLMDGWNTVDEWMGGKEGEVDRLMDGWYEISWKKIYI